MNIVLCYTYFNGYEQLKESISNMHEHVDSIILCYQSTSNTGNYSRQVYLDAYEIGHMFDKIWLLEYEPDLKKSTKQNERDKHNMMIQYAKKLEATHFIMAACDHEYTPEHIQLAKDYMMNNDCDLILTKMFTYYKQRNWHMEPLENYYMPFIHRMKSETCISSTVKYPVTVDPSVKVNTSQKIKIFEPHECVLHHYSMVRTDIEKKFINAAASIRWKPEQVQQFISEYNNAKPGDKISYFQNSVIVEK